MEVQTAEKKASKLAAFLKLVLKWAWNWLVFTTGEQKKQDIRAFWINMWGDNALVGHVVMILLGSFQAVLDTMLGRTPSLPLALSEAAAAIFATLRLPASGMDRKERKQGFLLTFAPSFIFGSAFGTVLGQMLFPGSKTGVGLTPVLDTMALVSIYISYYMVSQLSRDFRERLIMMKLGTGRAFALKGLIVELKNQKMHDEADQIIKLHLAFKREEGIELIRSLGKRLPEHAAQVVDDSVAEYLQTLYGNPPKPEAAG